VLAPVLARLDAIPGVVAARVDSSGRFFWLQVEDAAEAASVTALAFGVLGKGARSLAAAQTEAQLAARRNGDPWLTAAEVMTLSFVESRILSVRLASEVEHQTGATPEQREEVAEAIRLELFATMERVHSEGGRRSGGWIYEEWPAIAAAIVERCAATMPQDLCRRLSEVLPALRQR
jgi:hypothetical protein